MNFYDMEQNLLMHSNLFQDFQYIRDNLQKQKNRLFDRGKPAEWQLKKPQQAPERIKVLGKDREKALVHILPNVGARVGP